MAIVGAHSPFKKKASPLKLGDPATMGLIMSGVSALSNIFGGRKARSRASIQRAEAQREYDEAKQAYLAIEFVNPYEGIENPYANLENVAEDLTVNQEAAEYMRRQTQQQQANIMQGMRGAAGASGVAALAQSMANVGAAQAERASAVIAQQEQANRRMAAGESARLQQLKASGEFQTDMLQRKGEQFVRAQEQRRKENLYGLSIDKQMAANQAYTMAQQQISQGWAGLLGAGVGFGMQGGVGGLNHEFTSLFRPVEQFQSPAWGRYIGNWLGPK